MDGSVKFLEDEDVMRDFGVSTKDTVFEDAEDMISLAEETIRLTSKVRKK